MPHYDLKDVKALAQDPRNIRMKGNSRRDRMTLGYTMDDVQQCILSLDPDGFHKTHDYDTHIADAYKLSFRVDHQDADDPLYIKLYIDQRGHLTINVLSFHRDR